MQQPIQIRETNEGLVERYIPTGHPLNYDARGRDIVETYWCDWEHKVVMAKDNRQWLYPHPVLNGLQPYMGEFHETDDGVLKLPRRKSFELVDVIRNQNGRARKRKAREIARA